MKKNNKRVILSLEQKAQLYGLFYDKKLPKRTILRFGYDISELFEAYKITMHTQRDNPEEHYLCRCSKCNSNNIAIVRVCPCVKSNLTAKSNCRKQQPVIAYNYCYKVVCRECGTYTMRNNYVDAMVSWNNGDSVSIKDEWSLEDTQEKYFIRK